MRDLGNKRIMAKNLKALMHEKGVTAKELSRILKFPYTTVLSWLKGDNYPRIDKIEDMADYFGVLKSDLIEEKMTTEKEADNEDLVGIIARLRMDDDFFRLVKALSTLKSDQVYSVWQMLQTFTK